MAFRSGLGFFGWLGFPCQTVFNVVLTGFFFHVLMEKYIPLILIK